jgi:hypothetical protein
MSDPTPLLVPMALQALLVNGPVQSDAQHQFELWQNIYDQINQFDDPIPPPFNNLGKHPPQGVHLHWRLPSALTHGRAKHTEPVKFHYVPNRWLVARLASTQGAKTAPQLTAWVIESDYLGKDGSNPFVDPASTPANLILTNLGRNVPIAQWQGERGGQMFLTPTGVADVTFTAYQPGILDVFAFHDDTTQLPDDTLLTYLVCGWYSDPSHDPLAVFKLDDLEWTVLGTADPAPSLTVVHGLLYGLQWQTKKVPQRIDSDQSVMKVSLGYTAVDALAAIVADLANDTTGKLETHLEAFQYDLLRTLDDHDGTAQLELRIRRAWFAATPGGTLWQIVPVSQGQADQGKIDRSIVPPAPPLSEHQAKWLADLNVTQRKLDAARRELKTMQWDLFALWWKSKRGGYLAQDPAYVREQQQQWGVDLQKILDRITGELDPANSHSFIAAVLAQQSNVDALAKQLPDPTDPKSIADWSTKIPTGGSVALKLRPSALPAFFQPSDPVVLIAGLDPPTNDVDDDAPLPCRTLEAAVTGVNVGQNPVTHASGSLARMIAVPAGNLSAPVAAAVKALSLETFFVDPNNATCIVANGLGSSDSGTISALSTAMAKGTAQISTLTTFSPPLPALPAPFAFAPWQQAWAPLFLQWQIRWFPTVAEKPSGPAEPPSQCQYPADGGGSQDNWAFLADQWSFDGDDNVTARGSEYYQATGPGWYNQKPDQAPTYSGRTFLTPHATFLLLRRLKDYVKQHSGDKDLDDYLKRIEDLIESVGETRFLSQTLSGFNASFIMRGLTHTLAPPPPYADAVGGENRGVPIYKGGDQDLPVAPALRAQNSDNGDQPTPFFFPVRGGSFRFERLMIVDAFGQVLDLIGANGNSDSNGNARGPETFRPFRGAGLVPDPNSGITDAPRRLKQAPRVVQPSRLQLRLLDAADDAKEVFYAWDAAPVCGWLLPNHLDRSISAYDVGGNPLGELLVLATEQGQTVGWLPAPDVEPPRQPIDDPANISNPHLRDILSAFTDSGSPPRGIPPHQRVAAFNAFYQSIDETLWMVDPIGGQADHDLAVLIGRPLAVVRAQLQFELFGRPAYNQSWRDTLENVDADPGLTGLSFPIRLGSIELLDDGLIGYFTGDSYTTFNAVHPSTKAKADYVAAIGPGNYLSLPFNYPNYTTQNLTLLLDPRGSMHATTGVLPTGRLQIPPQFYTAALAQMAVTFRIGPVLTQPTTIRLPYPAERHGAWVWVRRKGTGDKDWEKDPIVPANAQARLADTPPHLMDGWLKFTPKTGM